MISEERRAVLIKELRGKSVAVENITPEYIYSAGANLTAAVAIKANKTGDFRLSAQVLGYGCFDMVTDPADKPESETNLIPVERSRMFAECYTENDMEKLSSIYCSHIFAKREDLMGLPPALIISAGFDNFRFEDADYAIKLVRAGVPVVMREFTESMHGFIIHCTHEREEAQSLIIKFLRSGIKKNESGNRAGKGEKEY